MILEHLRNFFFWLRDLWIWAIHALAWSFLYLRTHKRTRRRAELLVLAVLILAVVYNVLFGAPPYFPEQSLVRIKKGTTLEEAASTLKEKRYINSANLFELLARVSRSGGTIVAGEYAFNGPQNILTVAKRLTEGDFQLQPLRVRVVEGMTVAQITETLSDKIPDFEAEAFYDLALPYEGRLYPDTYFVLPGEEPELVLEAMRNNFNEHIREVSIATAIATFKKPIEEVITMASILEKEAATTQDRRIIAGILWRRLEAGMKLQVDATFLYINGKSTFNLTKKDLASDSPYNTYTHTGLPPGPIGSPSIDSLLAAVTPLKTSYVYYLSDMENVTHYSTTYEQHLAKKAKYLNN